MAAQRTLADWAMLMTLVALWGSSFLLTKVAVSSIPPESLVAIRVGVAAVVLVGVVAFTGRRWPRHRRPWGFFLAMALIGNALPFFLISWGQQAIDSGLAGILMAVMPLVTMVMAHFLVDGERLTLARILGFIMGFAGIIVLMGPEALTRLGQGEVIAQLAVLGGAVCYAVNTIIARHVPEDRPLVTSAGVMIMGSAIMVPLAGGLNGAPWTGDFMPAPASAVSALILGLLSTAFATIVYFRLIASAGPTFLSQINYLIPPWAVIVGVVFLNERLALNAYLALGLILGGIALSQFGTPAKPPVRAGADP